MGKLGRLRLGHSRLKKSSGVSEEELAALLGSREQTRPEAGASRPPSRPGRSCSITGPAKIRKEA